jgi:hypothetical protein
MLSRLQQETDFGDDNFAAWQAAESLHKVTLVCSSLAAIGVLQVIFQSNPATWACGFNI